MKDKEKQIEEIAKEIFNTCAWRFGKPNDYKEIFNDIAEDLTKLNYLKIDKDSVVLSKEEAERFRGQTINIAKVKSQERKETAKKFYDFAKAWFGNDEENDYFEELKIFAKQFGVEIKE